MDEKFWCSVRESILFEKSLPIVSRSIDSREFELLNEKIGEILEKFHQKGCYIIEAAEPDIYFTYPKGVSRIIYIGHSKNLKIRIRKHIKHFKEIKSLPHTHSLMEWRYSKYHYVNNFGAKVTLITPIDNNMDIESFEREILKIFYDRYLSFPLGNVESTKRSKI